MADGETVMLAKRNEGIIEMRVRHAVLIVGGGLLAALATCTTLATFAMNVFASRPTTEIRLSELARHQANIEKQIEDINVLHWRLDAVEKKLKEVEEKADRLEIYFEQVKNK